MEAMGSSVAMGGWRRPLIVHGQRAASTALEEDSKEQNSRDKAVGLLGHTYLFNRVVHHGYLLLNGLNNIQNLFLTDGELAKSFPPRQLFFIGGYWRSSSILLTIQKHV
jgi:hypothetical protein